MFINEVEHIVGISKKSIRYYEKEGLIKPTRNLENDYRIYSEQDITVLKKIKVLRELNVPILEIKKLMQKELTLEECMKDRIARIEEEEKNYQRIKEMCIEIANSKKEYSDIDLSRYLTEIMVLNKGGFRIKDIEQNKMKKIVGAVISSVVFNCIFLFLIGIITYFQLTESDQMPWIIYAFILFLLIIPVVSTIINLKIRVKEIKKGEEDEASKY